MILTGGSGLLLKKIKVKSQVKMTTRNMLTDKPQMFMLDGEYNEKTDHSVAKAA